MVIERESASKCHLAAATIALFLQKVPAATGPMWTGVPLAHTDQDWPSEAQMTIPGVQQRESEVASYWVLVEAYVLLGIGVCMTEALIALLKLIEPEPDLQLEPEHESDELLPKNDALLLHS